MSYAYLFATPDVVTYRPRRAYVVMAVFVFAVAMGVLNALG